MQRILTGRRALVVLAATGGALVLAACDTGNYTVRFTVGEAGIILNTTDAGATWQAQASGVKNNLNGVSFAGPTHGCAVGDKGTIVYTMDGSTWNSASSVPTTLKLNAVDVESYAEASLGGFAVGIKGTILQSDSCSSWTAQTSGTSANLNGVAQCRCIVPWAWAVGDYGTILITTDGSTWNSQTSGTGQSLESVSFVNASDGWAVGKRGVILNTTNGGTTWTPQTSGTSRELDGVVFADSLHGYAVGQNGVILSTSDGGATWIAQTSHTSQNLESVSTIFDGAVAYDDTGSGVVLATGDYNDAIAVGKNGVIRMTTNGGATWTISNSGTKQNLSGAS
jgi:photosystem II stability/assembly factor-like uncharacterized protein